MRLLAFVVVCAAFVSGAYAEIDVTGEVVVRETSYGCRYLGELVNNSSTPISSVKIELVVTDSTGNVIEEADGYVEGYAYPVTGANTYVPPGMTVPFSINGDTDPADVASVAVTVSYNELDVEYPSPVGITEIYRHEEHNGDAYYGFIMNNSQELYTGVTIYFVFKDTNGKIVDVQFTTVNGRDYLKHESWYYDGLVLPGESAPFTLNTFMEPDEYDSYYTIVSQRMEDEEEITFNEHWRGLLYVDGDIEKIDYQGYCIYQGMVTNDSGVHAYYVTIETVTRNAAGDIVDISSTYIDGTEYVYDGENSTDTHIAPGESASFFIVTETSVDESVTIDYYINYEFSQPPVAVEEKAPANFRLLGNFPNPFNPSTTIEFEVPDSQPVTLSVFSVTGQLLDEVVNDHLAPGIHSVTWDGSRYSSGTYLYRITSGNYNRIGRMMLIK